MTPLRNRAAPSFTLMLCLLLFLFRTTYANSGPGYPSTHNNTTIPATFKRLLAADSELGELEISEAYDDEEALTSANSYTCHVMGECEVCTELESKSQLYCIETGNKEPIECAWDGPVRDNASNDNLPSFRSCPRVKQVERIRFFEFQAANFVIAFTAGSILIWRQRKLARETVSRIARRVGTAV